MKRILLIGGGGHCKSIIDSIAGDSLFEMIGIIDKEAKSPVLGVPVIGNDDDLKQLHSEGWNYAFITAGSIGNTELRHRLYQNVVKCGFEIPTIIDHSAVIARDVAVGAGTYIGKNSLVNTGSRIGICSIINSGTIVEHDCSIGDFSHVSPGSVLCGQVCVGSDSHIGANSVIIQETTIGDNVMIGAGSVVTHSIPDGSKAYGNPCRVQVK